MKTKLLQELQVLKTDAELLSKPAVDGSIESTFNKTKLSSYNKTIDGFIVTVNKSDSIEEFIFDSRTVLSDSIVHVLDERKTLSLSNTVETRAELAGKLAALVDISSVVAIIDTLIACKNVKK